MLLFIQNLAGQVQVLLLAGE